MHRHQGAVRHICKGVFHGMETCEAALDKALRAVEVFLYAVLAPGGYICLRKHRYYMEVRDGRHEFFNGYAEYRLPSQFKELLGNGGTHSGANAAGRNDEVLFSLHRVNTLRKSKQFLVTLKVNRK